MPENGTIAYVNTAKKCDFPHAGEEVRDAEYDFRTVSGQWANGCEPHYLHYRMHNMLGLGKGQKLVTRPDIVGPVIPNGGEVPPNSHDSSDLI